MNTIARNLDHGQRFRILYPNGSVSSTVFEAIIIEYSRDNVPQWLCRDTNDLQYFTRYSFEREVQTVED